MPLRQSPQGAGGYVPPGGGGGSGFSTQLGVMDQAKGKVQETHDLIVNRVNQLIQECESLGANSWAGGGAAEFHKAHHQWEDAQRKLQTALQEIEQGLDRSRQHYAQADQATQAALGNAVSGLP
jgi:WXG100 family type VII secretion target